MYHSHKVELPSPQRLRWGCRRGMLELDLLLLPFFNAHYSQLSLPEQQAFATILEYPDPELYDYLINGQPSDEPNLQALFDKIRHQAR